MELQKRENLLNLALQVTTEERQKSLELNVGVLEEDRWEIIVKYHGNLAEKLTQLEQQYRTSFQTEFLLPGYAILTTDRRYLDIVSDLQEIDYIEKKFVKKPNGSKPGFVVYYTNYSLMIDSDISGIEFIE